MRISWQFYELLILYRMLHLGLDFIWNCMLSAAVDLSSSYVFHSKLSLGAFYLSTGLCAETPQLLLSKPSLPFQFSTQWLLLLNYYNISLPSWRQDENRYNPFKVNCSALKNFVYSLVTMATQLSDFNGQCCWFCSHSIRLPPWFWNRFWKFA